MPEKHALVIGINKYAYLDEESQLQGCVNDARLIRNTLIYKFNFERAQITELHDEAATRDGILMAMTALEKRVKKDDIVVFHYSGHGSRCKVKTQFTDEGSGKDNCLLPYDDSKPIAGSDKKEFREIRDNVINAWLQKLIKKTSNITLIFDACHSGTMTRGPKPEAKARSVPDAVRDQPAIQGRVRFPEKPSKRGAGGWLNMSNNYVVISGCRDTQRSKERLFDEEQGSYRHGVLTYCLIGELNKAQPGTTYRDIFESISSRVHSSVDDQNPQIEGTIDRELFGVKDIEPLAYLPITEVKGKTVTIGGGAAHGMRVDSTWQIYPAAIKTTEGIRPIDTAVVSKVGATSSTARLQKPNQKVMAGCRCITSEVVLRSELLRIKVTGRNFSTVLALKSELEKSKLLRVQSSKRDADVRMVLFKQGSKAARELQLSVGEAGSILLDNDCWVGFYNDGALAFKPHAVTERGINNLLRANLEKVAKFRRTLALENPASTIKAEFNLYRRKDGDENASKLILANGGGTEFDEDDGIVIEITNKEKEQSLFFSLVWLNFDMAIGQVYPPRKNSEEIAAGQTIRIGAKKDNFWRVGLGDGVKADAATVICKMMVTAQQSDFRWLSQEATRSNSQTGSSIKEFDVAFRGSKSEQPIKPKDDWLAINRSFAIKRTSKKQS